MWRVIVAAVVVGWFGLVGGYFVGPSYLCVDDCTAARLNGLFLSGPGGLAVGAALGTVAWSKKWRVHVFGGAVVLASVVAIAAGTALSWPEPLREAQVIEAKIIECKPPSTLSSESIAQWQRTIASEQWLTPRTGWQLDVKRMVSRTDGVVLTVQVLRRQDFLRRREPWRYGRVDSTGWRDENEREEFFARFAGRECPAYRPGETRHFAQEWEASSVSPPDNLPTFLGLYVIHPVSAEWRPPIPAG